MTTTLFATAYFGPVSWYWHFNRSQHPMVEACEHYVKQSWRNRCVIATANGPMTLSLPVEHDKSGHTGIKDIKLSEHGNWQHLHWNALIAAYKSSPYFDYYQDDLRPFFEQRPGYLFDFNQALHATVCDLLGINAAMSETETFFPEGQLPPDWTDLRYSLHPKRAPESTGFIAQPYYQVFDHKQPFLPNLSILDLLFNLGPEAILLL